MDDANEAKVAALIMMGDAPVDANIRDEIEITENNSITFPGSGLPDYGDKYDGVKTIKVNVHVPIYHFGSISISENNVTIKASEQGLDGFDEVTVAVDTSDAYEQGVIDGRQEQKVICDEEKAELIEEITRQDDEIDKLQETIDKIKIEIPYDKLPSVSQGVLAGTDGQSAYLSDGEKVEIRLSIDKDRDHLWIDPKAESIYADVVYIRDDGSKATKRLQLNDGSAKTSHDIMMTSISARPVTGGRGEVIGVIYVINYTADDGSGHTRSDYTSFGITPSEYGSTSPVYTAQTSIVGL